MFSDAHVTWTHLLFEQDKDKVRHNLSGREPYTSSEDFKFFAYYGAK